MASMLDDETTSDCIFVVDALDECADDRELLIELLTRLSSTSKSKWIVSSRNWPEIEAQLDGVAANRLHLELNHASIAEAVRRFISRRVESLAKRKGYTESTRATVQDHLLSNANDTFLWVSVVCEELAKYNVLPHHTSKVLQSFPAGLDKLYQRMIDQILHSRDAQTCKAILAVVTAAFEPLSLAELASSDESLACFQSDLQTLSSIVTCCGSFLTVRNDIVYTVHQSVSDYLLTSSNIFPSSVSARHYSIFQSTLQKIQATLHRNIYNAPEDTLYIHEISKPQSSVLDYLRYGCIYWVDHLRNSALYAIESPSTCLIVETFLKTKYLYWLEAMSLLGCVSAAIRAIRKLRYDLPKRASLELHDLTEDTLRFVLTHRAICDTMPLQLYDSALIFSPEGSQTKQSFIHELPVKIRLFPSSFQQWDASLFSIPNIADPDGELRLSSDGQLRVSSDGQKVAMTNGDDIIIIDSFTGEVLRKIQSHQYVWSVVGFDVEGKHLATVCGNDLDVTIWNTFTGEVIKAFQNRALMVVLFQDRTSLALADPSGLVRVCDAWDGSGNYTVDLRNGEGQIEWIDFGLTKSGAPCFFSIISTDTSPRLPPEVVVQDPHTGHVIARASIPTEWQRYCHAALDPDCKRLLIAQERELLLWDGEVLTDLPNVYAPEDPRLPSDIAWAPNGQSFVVAIPHAVILYDPMKKSRISRITLSMTDQAVRSRLCYVSGTSIALLDSQSFRMLRVTSTLHETSFVYDQEPKRIRRLNTGPNGQLGLSDNDGDNKVIITANRNSLCKLDIPVSRSTQQPVFSPDHHYAFGDKDGVINIWDTDSGLCLHKLRGHSHDTYRPEVKVEFDPSGQLVSANHGDGRIRIWNPMTGDCLRASSSQYCFFIDRFAASTDGCIAMIPIAADRDDDLYTSKLGSVDGGNAAWTVKCPVGLSFNSNGLLAVRWYDDEMYLSILDVNLGTCLVTYVFPSSIPYARFNTGSDSQIDVGHGVLNLDLERLAEAEQGVHEERFEVHSLNALPPVWNQQFLRLSFTDNDAWLTKGSKRVLCIPQATVYSLRVIPNFDTGASMAAMIFNSHVLIICIAGS